jgi:short chain dehydrogenase
VSPWCQARLDGLAAEHPGQVDVLPLDVTDTAAINATVQEVIGRHGRIDVLVNNAGRTHVGAAEETTDAELRDLASPKRSCLRGETGKPSRSSPGEDGHSTDKYPGLDRYLL